jgi:hypothetical protein
MSSTADEYTENAKAMLRRAITAATEDEREEYLRLAAAWSLLAADAAKTAKFIDGVLPFAEPPPNPLADESEF